MTGMGHGLGSELEYLLENRGIEFFHDGLAIAPKKPTSFRP